MLMMQRPPGTSLFPYRSRFRSIDGARRGGKLVDLLHSNAYRVLAVEGKLSGGGFVEDYAQLVDIAGAGELLALSLLGRYVVGSAQNGCRLREPRVACARNAEVHYLDVAIRLDHDVLRLYVPVHYAASVCTRTRMSNLNAAFRRLSLIDCASFIDGGFKIGSAEELHNNVVGFAV